jgi:hypothetical protein
VVPHNPAGIVVHCKLRSGVAGGGQRIQTVAYLLAWEGLRVTGRGRGGVPVPAPRNHTSATALSNSVPRASSRPEGVTGIGLEVGVAGGPGAEG